MIKYKTTSEMENEMKLMLIDYIKTNYNETYKIENIQTVWFSKTLQNIKAVMIDLGNNQRIYELTYNGYTEELYIDMYKKQHHVCITDVNKVKGE